MNHLIITRHGQSQWNLENRFTGWEDVDLTEVGVAEAVRAGELLKDFQIDAVYSSTLKRALRTVELALDSAAAAGANLDRLRARDRWNVIQHDDLRERHYGDLVGLNKAETCLLLTINGSPHIFLRCIEVILLESRGVMVTTCICPSTWTVVWSVRVTVLIRRFSTMQVKLRNPSRTRLSCGNKSTVIAPSHNVSARRWPPKICSSPGR